MWSTEDPYALDAWSDGISFYFPGYDTSLFWDEEDGDKLYVQGSLYWRVRLNYELVDDVLTLESGDPDMHR